MRNRRRQKSCLPFAAFGAGLLAALVFPQKLLLIVAAAALVLLGYCCVKS